MNAPLSTTHVDTHNLRMWLSVSGGGALPAIDRQHLRIDTLAGQEAISQPYSFNLELRADDIAGNAGLVFNGDYIGHWCTIRIERLIGEDRSLPARFFKGILTEVTLGDPGCYSVSISSPLHLLSLRNRYFIFDDCDFQGLVNALFADELRHPAFNIAYELDDAPTLTRTQDWLQAGESDLDMFNRVARKMGVYFYFIHEAQMLTLVVANTPTRPASVAIPAAAEVPVPLRYTYTDTTPVGLGQYDVFKNPRYAKKMVPGGVRNLLTRTEAEWERNEVAGFTNYDSSRGNRHQLGYQHHQYYDYGGSAEESEGQLQKICQQIRTDQGTLTGSVNTELFSPGYTFRLIDPRQGSDLPAGRPDFAGNVFVVTQIKHQAKSTERYTGEVTATDVVVEDDHFNKTLLTPFSIQDTQQGSIVARVIDHEPPRGWRYRKKSNFHPEQAQASFEGERYDEKGVLVELATGQRHWVTLSRSAQTIPEVGAMVTVGRGSNQSEEPELQQVMAAHGSKVITPPGRRNASWQANTNWGSSYSTSYGDSISIRYGHSSATELEKAVVLVEGAYDNAGVFGTDYGNTSYSKGSSFSISLSDNKDRGALSASISQGSSANESHAANAYSYSSTGVAESYNEVGKSVSESIVGTYNPAPNLEEPSFVSGKLPHDLADYTDKLVSGDSFNKSWVKFRSISLNGVGAPAPDVNPLTVLPGSYQSSVTLGVSEGHQKLIGASIQDSLTVGAVASTSVNLSNQLNQSTTIGNSLAMDTRIGDTTSVSTNIGMRNSAALQVAGVNTAELSVGTNNSSRVNVSEANRQDLTVGAASDLNTYIGSKSSVSTMLGTTSDTSVSLASKNSNQVFIGSVSDNSVNISSRINNSVSLGTANENSIYIGSKTSNSVSLSSATESSIYVGARNSSSISISASNSMETKISAAMSMTNNLSASMELLNSLSASLQIINQASADTKIVNGVLQSAMEQRPQVVLKQSVIEILLGIEMKM